MFLTTYDLREYGKMIRKLRVREKLSQQDIRDVTGVHTDTLRRIEKGDTIPKYSTLEILSIMYKVNLIELLNNFKVHRTVYDLYLALDQIITSNKANTEQEFNDLIDELENLDSKSMSWRLVNEPQLRQLILFVKSTKDFLLRLKSFESIITSLIDCLDWTIDNYNLNQFYDYNYNHLELRILLVIALCEVEKANFCLSNKILIFIKDDLSSREYLSNEETKLLLKTVSNIAYNNYKLNLPNETLKSSNLGIEIAKEYQTMYSTHLLYARRSVAKFKLGIKSYKNDIYICLALLEAQDLLELKELYIKIFEKNYNYKCNY